MLNRRRLACKDSYPGNVHCKHFLLVVEVHQYGMGDCIGNNVRPRLPVTDAFYDPEAVGSIQLSFISYDLRYSQMSCTRNGHVLMSHTVPPAA